MTDLTPLERDIIDQAEAINRFALELVDQDRRGQRIWWGDVDKIAKMATHIIRMHRGYAPINEETRIDDAIEVSMAAAHNGEVGPQRLIELWEVESQRVSSAWLRLAAMVDAEPVERGMSASLGGGIVVRTYELAGRVMMTLAAAPEVLEEGEHEVDFTWIGEDGKPEKGLGLQSVHGTTAQMQRFVDLLLMWDGELVADKNAVLA